MIRVAENDNGREIHVPAGETLELVLPEVSGTGFKWVLMSSGAPILLLEKEDHVSSEKMPGSQRMHCWQFKALQAGTARIELNYARTWERRPVRSFTLEIRI